MTLYAEMDGKPRTNIPTLTQERLSSSEKTRPRTNVRYAGEKFVNITSSSFERERERERATKRNKD
jgi:hypothetical protein